MNSSKCVFVAVLFVIGYGPVVCRAVDMDAVRRESCANLDDSLASFVRGDSYSIFSLFGGRRRDLRHDLQFCGKDVPMQWRVNMTRQLVDLFDSLEDEDGLSTVARKRNIIELIGGSGRGPLVEEFFLKLFEYPNDKYRDTLLRYISPAQAFSDAIYDKIKEKEIPWKIKKTLLLHFLKDANPRKALPEIQEEVRQTTSHEDYYHMAGLLCRGYPPEAMDPLMDRYDDMLYIVAKDLESVHSYRHPSSGFIQCEKNLADYAQQASGIRQRTAIDILKHRTIVDRDLKARLEKLFPADFAPPKPVSVKPEVKKSIPQTERIREVQAVRYTVGRDREFNSSSMVDFSTAVVTCGGKKVFEQFFPAGTKSLHLTPKGLPYGPCSYMTYTQVMGWDKVNFYNVELEAELSPGSFKYSVLRDRKGYKASFGLKLKSGEGLVRLEMIRDGALVWARPMSARAAYSNVELEIGAEELPKELLFQVVDKRGVYLQKYFTLNKGGKEGMLELSRQPDNRGRLVPTGRNVRVDLNSNIYVVFDEVYAAGEIDFNIQNRNPYYPIAGEALQDLPAYEIQSGGLLSFHTATITFQYDKEGLSLEQEEGQQISRLIPASSGGPLERYKAKVDKKAGTVSVTVKSLGNFVRTMPAFKKAYVTKSSRLVNGLPELEVHSDRKIDIVESPRVAGDSLQLSFNDTHLVSAFYGFSPAGQQLEPSGKIIMRYDPAKLPLNPSRCPPAIRRTGSGWRKILNSAPPTEQVDYLENTSEIVYMACPDMNPSIHANYGRNE